MNVYDVLEERGFIEQVTNGEAVRRMLSKPSTCYIGFDPTSDSFHTGSLVPIMALKHMQQHGHRVIVLIGGGTAMIGDPSGRTELRKLMTMRRIDANADGHHAQQRRLAHPAQLHRVPA
jgi:tyrosyl-tRNA synthetase